MTWATIQPMQLIRLRPFGAILLCVLTLGLTPAARAQSTDWEQTLGPGHWRLMWAPGSIHWRYSAEHRNAWALGVERQRSDDWLAGGSYFQNSFGQPSGFVYVGKRFPELLGQRQLFAQASGGILYGYRGKFESKVPLNYKGFAPGALLSLGWQFTPQASLTTHLLGDAGLMFQLAYDLR